MNPWRKSSKLAATLLFLLIQSSTAMATNPLDPIIASEQQKGGVKLPSQSVVNDGIFLRRVYVDLIGRIPTEAEVMTFAKQPPTTRRADLVDQLLADERFADRWTLFYADMLRLRSQATGGAALFAWVHNALKTKMPYDEMCRKLIATNGKAGKVPESGFILGDDADPLVMASVTSQVFMGVRIGCAQCHDHPFDEWKRRDFYDLAAFYGKTRRYESQLTKVVYATEGPMSVILWPPEGEAPAEDRQAIPAKFPFPLKGIRGETDYITRLQKLRAQNLPSKTKVNQGPSLDDLLDSTSEKAAKTASGKLKSELAVADAKKDIRKIDIQKGMYQPSELREKLAELVTDPKNGLFSRALVNRVWKTLIGRGFVEPVDDFREENPPALAPALDYLAEEFVASNYDLRALVKLVITSDAYQRGHAPVDIAEPTRDRMEEYLFATPVRRMIAESLYDSIVTAGHLFEVKHSPGRNEKTIYDVVRVLKEGVAETEDGSSKKPVNQSAMTGMNAMMGEQMSSTGGSYGLESAIELDFTTLLKEQDADDEDVALETMRAASKEEIEAQRLMAMRNTRRSAMDYEEKKVARLIDDNPTFSTSLRMQSPAPDGHFLRIFGQPNRTELGDLRDDTASMRQSLMMLNGRITNEASRVGDLEPIYRLLTGKSADANAAIQLAYLEVLTRRPSAAEMTEAKEIIASAESPLDGMADLRWVLLNCHEFRFLP